jgi:hypothetical protein
MIGAMVSAGHAKEHDRWLWGHVDTAMGIGDQLHFHEALLLLARETARTAVLPPLQLTVTDFGPVADVDPTADGGRAFDAALARALHGAIRNSANLPGKVLKLVGKGLGDTTLDILTAGDPGAGGVQTAYCVTNGGEEFCHCSVFSGCAYKLVAGDTGAKLVCKNGTADAGCSAIDP